MRFYMTPGSCSTGIHILLEELDLAFEVYPVNLLAGDHQKPDYLAMNPKGSIPLLIKDDGTPITEFQAIAVWLARKYPKRGLLPSDLDDEVRVFEIMDYAIATIHMQGFARIFTTANFALNEAAHEAVIAKGRTIVEAGFSAVEKLLGDRDYVGTTFSIADAALFYVEFWATRTDIALPPKLEAHYRRMIARPAVARVLAEEGYRVT
jgi:glutathione S-transferase